MTPKEFVSVLSETYGEPMLRDGGAPNLKLKFIKKWCEQFKPAELNLMVEKVIKGFVPTYTNPCPLIPHIVEICEIQTTDDMKKELARTVADRCIYAILNIGHREAGSRDKAYTYIGSLGKSVLTQSYGLWHTVCEVAQNESIEVMRSHIRDSVYAYINRTEKGIENQVPELTDLNCKKQLSIGSL